ncbi:hypothetical protein QAD02_008957 [Eretmocerus hayati]|uniref:Uncharacterized protein n=1 Tax=Eretmocerus hayati TaxID=131215 RepID=A0ACC2N7X8_9HYME|nr:hypothetical protein QAD02_008957 [Eretmocerus hayati]
MTATKQQVGLQRELGLFSAVSMIVAVMIGSGIFVSPTSALKYSGSVGLCLIVWLVSGGLSLLGALAFAELSSLVPRSGAEYAYFIDAFSPLHAYLGPLPAFLCSWIYVFVLRPAEQWDQVKKLIAILALTMITYINLTSVKLFVKVQNIFTMCKVAACLLVIGGGIWWLSTGHTKLLDEPFKGTTTSPGQIALAFYSGLWAYDGWSSAAIVAEEVQRPELNILRSIVIAVPIVTALYCGMNLAYMSALSPQEMIKAPAVAVLWAERVLPAWLGAVIPLGVALSTFGCGLSLQFAVARLCYVAGQEGHVPRFFSWVHHERNTPAASVALQGALSLLCLLVSDIVELIEFASFLIWVFYGLTMIALLVMRKTKPTFQRTYRVPTVVPWLVLMIAVFLSIMPMYEKPSIKYLFVLGFVAIGWIVYHRCVYRTCNSSNIRKLTYLVQMLFMVVAPDEIDESKKKMMSKEATDEVT